MATTPTPQQLYVVLMTQVAAFRWITDPSYRERREPKLLEILDHKFESESAIPAATLSVTCMRACWFRHQRDPTPFSGGDKEVWDGWDEEHEAFHNQLEPLQAAMTATDLETLLKWHDWFDHFRSMDTVLRHSHE